ncbi:FHA domain-containing protein [Paraneptunicella aestuarii]|uniref:FHA domain-containing protein n=1 Tax=Paraneptunicella aestuarii TaxID=2831148 RepID=UPI001E2F89C3|nr:FHA domain-containing protein [Paraneptunicella aestuarii]UAA39305.1 FHA domain-containing protein [Paraneptunicella aestuarii]
MAYLLDAQKNIIILSQYHSIGRMQYSVDTVIEREDVSRFHAVIEWREQGWVLKDVSSNGVWINQIRVQKNELVPLKLGAQISFGNNKSPAFLFADDAAPEDVLFLYDTHLAKPEQSRVIALYPYHLLPDQQSPEVVLYKNDDIWWAEKMQGGELQKRRLKDRDLISIQGVRWQLRVGTSNDQTRLVDTTNNRFEELLAEFNVSQDEESIQLMVIKGANQIDLKVRNYHYLSLYLARRRASDLEKGFTPSEMGWVYVEEVAKDLGLEETTINLHVHRARKQFVNSLNAVNNAVHFIERRPSQLRLGGMKYRILKADRLECEIPVETTSQLVS